MSPSLRRTFDWRFLAMLAFLVMVCYLVLTGVTAIQQNAEKGHQIDALISAAAEQDAAASQERAELRGTQKQLLHRLTAYEQRQRALLEWLREHGIDIPKRFIDVPVLAQRPTTHHRHKHRQQTSPPSAPPVDQPGKSDGHRKKHHPKGT